jgi:hypothetical protein
MRVDDIRQLAGRRGNRWAAGPWRMIRHGGCDKSWQVTESPAGPITVMQRTMMDGGSGRSAA